jgi:hypothetical protein
MSTTELFTAAASSLPGAAAKLGSYLLFITGSILFFSFIYSFGAAKLSYAYNTSIGSSSAFVWAILAFFFSGLYYPYYAFFVNPVGAPPASLSVPLMGGRRRKI